MRDSSPGIDFVISAQVRTAPRPDVVRPICRQPLKPGAHFPSNRASGRQSSTLRGANIGAVKPAWRPAGGAARAITARGRCDASAPSGSPGRPGPDRGQGLPGRWPSSPWSRHASRGLKGRASRGDRGAEAALRLGEDPKRFSPDGPGGDHAPGCPGRGLSAARPWSPS